MFAAFALYALFFLASYMIVSGVGVLDLLGRDSGLTGRNYIYGSWFQFFIRKPLFGYGFGEAFNGSLRSVGVEMSLGTGYTWFKFYNFESGVLQLLIDFGLAGGILFFWIFRGSFQYATSQLDLRDASGPRFNPAPLAIWLYCAISSLNEVIIVTPNADTLFFVVFLFAKNFQAQGRSPRGRRVMPAHWRPGPAAHPQTARQLRPGPRPPGLN